MSVVQFYLHSEFLYNLAVTPMLGKCKGQAKACSKKLLLKNIFFKYVLFRVLRVVIHPKYMMSLVLRMVFQVATQS